MCVVTFDWGKNDAIEKFNRFGKKRGLSWVVLEVTQKCNFRCKWCYAGSGNTGKHMKREDMHMVIDSLADSGIRQITISGGEPTVYPHLKEAVKRASDKGLIVHMNTNGFLLTRKLAAELKSLGLSQVQMNIDSVDPDKHDAIRGRKNSHKRVIRAFENARAAGLTCVSQTVVSKENESEIIDIFRIARNIGVQRCRTWDMMSSGAAVGKEDLRPTSYISTLENLARFAEETGATNIESGDPIFPFFTKTSLNISGGFCVASGGLLTNINYNGDVYYCVTQRGLMFNFFRDFHGGNFMDFYYSKLEEFKKSINKANCEGCTLLEKCNHGCYTRTVSSGGERDYACPGPLKEKTIETELPCI